ncbi:MAG: DGQHR domain-containing protein [Cytophagales bacterium]|nr:DGQHR domain-containing protein [Cytophagales bacterium]
MASIDWKDVKTIARADIRRIEKGEGGQVETYLGIQRGLSNSRVKEIGRYVTNIDATFPTAVLLHISSHSVINEGSDQEQEVTNIEFDRQTSEMKIREGFDVATILDGQHRLEGLRLGFSEAHPNADKFQLNVAIFVDLDMDDQSMVFATVNKAQTKVNKSLVYDLFAYANTRSPQRTAHSIVRLLNEKDGSPFKDMVKILGTADDPNRETITQSTIAECLIKYISAQPMQDRDKLKRKQRPKRAEGDEQQRLFFRNLFIDEKDADIARIVWNLFDAVKTKWPDHWETTLLSKSTGVIAFMKFLKPSYLHLASKIGDIVSKNDFLKLIEKVNINGADFTKENYLPGTSGQAKLYKELVKSSGL